MIDKETGKRKRRTEPVIQESMPNIFPCGCSRHKVALGQCDSYDESGQPRGKASECKVYVPDGSSLLTCAACGDGIERHRHLNPLDVNRTEAAADRIVAFCAELGIDRREVGSALLSIAVNHMVAEGVTLERACFATSAMYQWRKQKGHNERVLVPAYGSGPLTANTLLPAGWTMNSERDGANHVNGAEVRSDDGGATWKWWPPTANNGEQCEDPKPTWGEAMGAALGVR